MFVKKVNVMILFGLNIIKNEIFSVFLYIII